MEDESSPARNTAKNEELEENMYESPFVSGTKYKRKRNHDNDAIHNGDYANYADYDPEIEPATLDIVAELKPSKTGVKAQKEVDEKEAIYYEDEKSSRAESIVLLDKSASNSSLKIIKGKLVCVLGADDHSGLAQEPWPKDVKLYQPYEVEQILLPDNANCLAVQAFLRMCNLEFEVVSRANAEFMSPSGKVPFIKCGAFIISELEGIVQFVNNKGISLTANMESEQKSDMRAYMSLVHNVLENAELYLCWMDKETYNEVTKPRNGSVYPWPLNYFQTWSKKSTVCKRLKMMGWYNKTLEDVYQEVENCCQALTDRLEGKEYFFGKRYTEMDALVYGHVYTILTVPLPADDNRLAFLVKGFEKLIDHCRSVHQKVMRKDNDFFVTAYSEIRVSSIDSDHSNITTAQSDTDLKETITDTATDDNGDAESTVSSDVTSEDLLFADFPTELDALVFGHLFTILTTPLPNSQIANTVRTYPALIHLVQRIEKGYFKRETKH